MANCSLVKLSLRLPFSRMCIVYHTNNVGNMFSRSLGNENEEGMAKILIAKDSKDRRE